MVITVINGPNLNLLGKRENDIYGTETFESFLESLLARYSDTTFNFFQSNIEGEIINYLQEVGEESNGVILNAGGYTHTSVAIADAVKAISTPVVEVHISNISAREEFRHTSLISPVCAGTIFGFGLGGYELAIEAILKKIVK